ncbi:MAG TPA: hypothetical protein VF407_10280 [Polyangiaceae bacterium]
MLLRGRDDDWKTIATKGVKDDLWDLCWFGDELYVSSMSTLYVLQGDALAPVDYGQKAPGSAYRLSEAQGVLWSLGQQSLLSFDGKTWQRWE